MAAKKSAPATAKTHKNEIIKRLAEMSQMRPAEEDAAIFEGTQFVIPEMYNGRLDRAADRLHEIHESLGEFDRYSRQINVHPFDGAYMFALACKELFGVLPSQAPPSMFQPGGASVSVNVSPTEKVDVPWGRFDLPLLDAEVRLGSNPQKTFTIGVECPKKYKPQVHGLFDLIEELARTRSIYRGNAIDSAEVPNVIDLATFDPDSVIYTQDTLAQVEANILAPLRFTDTMREHKQTLKRSVILEGDFGNGKTLCGLLTATVAQTAGWTYIACRPSDGQDPFESLRLAKMYQPSVVFIEDVDTIANTSDPQAISRLLDEFDGMGAKNLEMFVVMTTNHAERIHRGMLRPGRLDAVVHIGNQDRESLERFIRVVLADKLAKDVDFDAVYESMRGYSTAFVKEAVDRTVRYMIARNFGEPKGEITTEDLVNAANSLRPHLALMERANEGVKPDTLTGTFAEIVRSAVVGAENEAGPLYAGDEWDTPDDPVRKLVYRNGGEGQEQEVS